MAWFTCVDQKVEGPFLTEDLKRRLTEGLTPSGCLIWGRGQSDWQPASSWTGEAPSASSASPEAVVRPLKKTSEHGSDQWHYAIEGESRGPVTRAQLIHQLKNIREKEEILIWTKGMKEWADLYDFEDLVKELGLNRRIHQRVKVDGVVIHKSKNGAVTEGHLRTLSAGGFGAGGFYDQLQMGQEVLLEIQSEDLGDAFTVKAQVQYTTEKGFVGFEFKSVGAEAKSRIMRYVSQQNQKHLKAA